MDFSAKVTALVGQYGKNLRSLTHDSTERIFYLRKTQSPEFRTVSKKDIIIGKFYLIKYDYNGNEIYCPIFPLEYKVIKNKHILYAVNLDYLPYSYKRSFFGELFNRYKDTVDKNEDVDVSKEIPLKGVNFENIYKILQKNGKMEFAVTAFDINKIIETNVVSTTIMDRFIFLNTRMVNSALMKELATNTKSEEFKEKLDTIVEEYDNLKITYEEDTKYFYKRLRAFEKNYKLIDS